MKTVRQQRILELIQMHDIEKQEELVQMLCEDGFDVTQATVSRDISQLRLKKVSGKMENLSIRQQNQSTNRPNQISSYFKGILCQYGYGNEYTSHKNSFWYGNGSGSST